MATLRRRSRAHFCVDASTDFSADFSSRTLLCGDFCAGAVARTLLQRHCCAGSFRGHLSTNNFLRTYSSDNCPRTLCGSPFRADTFRRTLYGGHFTADTFRCTLSGGLRPRTLFRAALPDGYIPRNNFRRTLSVHICLHIAHASHGHFPRTPSHGRLPSGHLPKTPSAETSRWTLPVDTFCGPVPADTSHGNFARTPFRGHLGAHLCAHFPRTLLRTRC